MKLIVCSVFDKKAGAYMQPFFVPNVNIARRSFGDAVMNHDTGISKHPEDYALYQVGVFDDNRGTFDLMNKSEFLANATDYIVNKPEVENEADSR